ncbi:hypothetical protein N9545_04495 [Salibacteraceae bacterium]|jgi:hypothetical protein|nr:hypothetical protein [Salibacteraceae bacterium]MDB9708814.1 hypothetical protein [Salibacteraceae bacterium]MDC1304959.1 hypothetical protein [Salibacteraceae bacterium]
MWKAYKYIYYWLYTWNRGLWGESDLPELNAVLALSLAFVCNILSLMVLVYIATGGLIIQPGIPKIESIFLLLIVMALHYFSLMHNGKYQRIEKEFQNESKGERKRKGALALIYIFGSMVFYMFLLFFGIWLKKQGL